MATVETVRGTVDLHDLGTTLMHEHVFVLDPEALQNYGSAFGEFHSFGLLAYLRGFALWWAGWVIAVVVCSWVGRFSRSASLS